jgi:putative membrane protein
MTDLPRTLTFFLWHSWDWDLSKVVGCVALILIYGFWTRLNFLRESALASPLDALGDEYLFSAHMLQHIILLMIVPVLLLMGLPEEPARQLLRIRWIAHTEHVLSNPVLAWTLANLILWFWHLPSFYVLAVQNEGIHIFEHLTFLISATIFWWPVLAPTVESRLSFWDGTIYIFTAALSNMALSIILTFMDEPLYGPYVTPEDSWNILNLLRIQFHLDPVADQKLGGILMWVFGNAIFLGVLLTHFGRWYVADNLERK